MKMTMENAVLEGTPGELAEYILRLQGKQPVDIGVILDRMFRGGSGNATNRADN